MEIRTERLVLRDFALTDTAAVLAYQSDPRYLRFTPWASRTEDEVRGFVEMLVGWAAAEPRTKFQFALVLDGTLIGTCGVRLAEPGAREAEYGCELAPSAWGHGYAEEGSRAVLDHGFRALGLHRVFSSTIADNAAAIALAERLGMRREGCLRENVWLHGRWQDTVIHGVLDREWRPAG